MTANTTLIHAIAQALVGEYGEDATGWLEDGGRANVERIVAEWRTAIEEGRWIERTEDVLVLRALRHYEHWVEVLGGPDAETLIRELADEDWRARGVETTTRIGEVFAHELLRGDTGEPFESIEYDWREHGNAIRGEDDEQRGTRQRRSPEPRPVSRCASPRRVTSSAGSRSSTCRRRSARRKPRWTQATRADGPRSRTIRCSATSGPCARTGWSG